MTTTIKTCGFRRITRAIPIPAPRKPIAAPRRPIPAPRKPIPAPRRPIQPPRRPISTGKKRGPKGTQPKLKPVREDFDTKDEFLNKYSAWRKYWANNDYSVITSQYLYKNKKVDDKKVDDKKSTPPREKPLRKDFVSGKEYRKYYCRWRTYWLKTDINVVTSQLVEQYRKDLVIEKPHLSQFSTDTEYWMHYHRWWRWNRIYGSN